MPISPKSFIIVSQCQIHSSGPDGVTERAASGTTGCIPKPRQTTSANWHKSPSRSNLSYRLEKNQKDPYACFAPFPVSITHIERSQRGRNFEHFEISPNSPSRPEKSHQKRPHTTSGFNSQQNHEEFMKQYSNYQGNYMDYHRSCGSTRDGRYRDITMGSSYLDNTLTDSVGKLITSAASNETRYFSRENRMAANKLNDLSDKFDVYHKEHETSVNQDNGQHVTFAVSKDEDLKAIATEDSLDVEIHPQRSLNALNRKTGSGFVAHGSPSTVDSHIALSGKSMQSLNSINNSRSSNQESISKVLPSPSGKSAISLIAASKIASSSSVAEQELGAKNENSIDDSRTEPPIPKSDTLNSLHVEEKSGKNETKEVARPPNNAIAPEATESLSSLLSKLQEDRIANIEQSNSEQQSKSISLSSQRKLVSSASLQQFEKVQTIDSSANAALVGRSMILQHEDNITNSLNATIKSNPLIVTSGRSSSNGLTQSNTSVTKAWAPNGPVGNGPAKILRDAQLGKSSSAGRIFPTLQTSKTAEPLQSKAPEKVPEKLNDPVASEERVGTTITDQKIKVDVVPKAKPDKQVKTFAPVQRISLYASQKQALSLDSVRLLENREDKLMLAFENLLGFTVEKAEPLDMGICRRLVKFYEHLLESNREPLPAELRKVLRRIENMTERESIELLGRELSFLSRYDYCKQRVSWNFLKKVCGKSTQKDIRRNVAFVFSDILVGAIDEETVDPSSSRSHAKRTRSVPSLERMHEMLYVEEPDAMNTSSRIGLLIMSNFDVAGGIFVRPTGSQPSGLQDAPLMQRILFDIGFV